MNVSQTVQNLKGWLMSPQLSPTDSEYQVLSQTWTHVPRPRDTLAPRPRRRRFSGCGAWGRVSPSPPPSTQAAASAQFSSSPTRVHAAVGPPEEILSFAQPPGTQSCLEQLGGGGGWGRWAAPRSRQGLAGRRLGGGNQGRGLLRDPHQEPAPLGPGIHPPPPAEETWACACVPLAWGPLFSQDCPSHPLCLGRSSSL